MAKNEALSKYLAELGRKGGTKTAKNRTAQERSKSARKAAQARWAKRRKGEEKA